MNGPNDDTFINNVIMAMAAGAISSAIASPTDRIKVLIIVIIFNNISKLNKYIK